MICRDEDIEQEVELPGSVNNPNVTNPDSASSITVRVILVEFQPSDKPNIG